MYSNRCNYSTAISSIAGILTISALALSNGVMAAAASNVKCDTPCIQAKEIDKGAVKRSSIRGNAVNSAKIKDESITSLDIKDGSIVGADIRDESISGHQIVDGSLRSRDIGSDAVSSSKILDETITSLDIKDGTIVGADIRDGSISGHQIVDGSLRSSDIGSDAVSSSKILDEPGIDFVTSRTVKSLPDDEIVNVLTITISASSPGYVTCSVDAWIEPDHTVAFAAKFFDLAWEQGDSAATRVWQGHNHPDMNTRNDRDTYMMVVTSSSTFVHPGGAQSYKFIAKYKDLSSASLPVAIITVEKNNARCMYFPTRY